MRRISLLAAAASLSLPAVPIALPTPAMAMSPGVSQFCKELRSTDPGFASISQGRCVSYFTQVNNYFKTGNTHAVAVQYCKILEEYDKAYFDSLYSSQSDCVDQVEPLL